MITINTLLSSFLLFYTGCVIPESNHVEPDYYLLTETNIDQNKNSSTAELSFYLREIELPRYLKESRMIYRPTDHTIEFREHKRWGEPLEDGIARVLSLNIQNQVSKSHFTIFPNRRKDNLEWDISISFSSFEKVSDQLVIDANWIATSRTGAILSGSYSLESTLQDPLDELEEIKSFNLGLYKLANDILNGIASQ